MDTEILRDIKKITTVNIRLAIIDHAKKHHIKLSEWINETYGEHFLNINSKIKRLEEIKQEEKRLIQEISELEQRSEINSKNLTTREIQFISQVPSRLREGKDLISMCNFYNNEFGKSLEVDEFSALVKFYKEELSVRWSYAREVKKKRGQLNKKC